LSKAVLGRLNESLREQRLLEQLSDQERRVFDLVAEGHTNREISERLFLAEKTVRNYVSNVLAKLTLKRRAEMAAFAARVVSDRHLGPRQLTGLDLGHGPEVRVAGHGPVGVDVGQGLANDRVLGPAHLAGELDQALRPDDAGAPAPAPDGGPLVHQRGEGDGPAAVYVAEAVVVGHAHVGEEDLVERGPTGDLAKGPDLHARRLHVDDD